jgi:3-phenylpropionate/cinnamic acid dioxygenase small subunit
MTRVTNLSKITERQIIYLLVRHAVKLDNWEMDANIYIVDAMAIFVLCVV